MNRLIQLQKTAPLFVIALLLACFVLAPASRGVTPAPDGGYPNGNTAEGDLALYNLTTGTFNTATGLLALFSNTYGDNNTAIGVRALFTNTHGYANTAVGARALESNRTGSGNTAVGVNALSGSDSDSNNTAIGMSALFMNSRGSRNTAVGALALVYNTTGSYNAATGSMALYSNKTGRDNTADGAGALWSNTTGSYNAANGFGALLSNTTGKQNIALGPNAGYKLTTGDNNIDIGNEGVAGEANTIRIGKAGTHTDTFIAGISGATVAGNVVVCDSNGHLGTAVSSARFKDDIKPMDKASEAILALKPVTFHYKKELDPEGIPQFGLVAEHVEKVNPDLVVKDSEGKLYTVRYEAVNAMLLNEFLKEHRTVQEQKATIAELKHNFAEQQKQIEALTAGLQKVSAQLEASKSAPQVVNNP